MSGDGTKPTLLRQDEVLAVLKRRIRKMRPIVKAMPNNEAASTELDVCLSIAKELSALPPASPAEVERLRAALERAQKALALVVRPNREASSIAIAVVYATCVEAEAVARATLSTPEDNQ